MRMFENRERTSRSGFTLLELLVSMVILGVIVVICGRIFDQSTVAWDSGSRKAELNLTGRAVVDLMAQEISQAVDDGQLLTQRTYESSYITNLAWGATKIRFITLNGTPSSTARALRWVEYWQDTDSTVSPSVPVLRRSSRYWPNASSYAAMTWAGSPRETASANEDAAEHVTGLHFYPSYSGGGLPKFVDVEVQVARQEEIDRGLTSNYVYRTRAFLENANGRRFE